MACGGHRCDRPVFAIIGYHTTLREKAGMPPEARQMPNKGLTHNDHPGVSEISRFRQ